MKRWIYIALTCALFFAGCQQTPNITVDGEVTRAQNGVEQRISQMESDNAAATATGQTEPAESQVTVGSVETASTAETVSAPVESKTESLTQVPSTSAESVSVTGATTEKATASSTASTVAPTALPPAADTPLARMLGEAPSHITKTVKAGGKTMVIDAEVVIPEGVTLLHTFFYTKRDDFDAKGLIQYLFRGQTPEFEKNAYVAWIGRDKATLRIGGGPFQSLFFEIGENVSGNKYLGPSSATKAAGCSTTLVEAGATAQQFLQRFSLGDFRIVASEIRDQASYKGTYSATGSYQLTAVQFADGLPVRGSTELDGATQGQMSLNDDGFLKATFLALDLKPTKEVTAILSPTQAVEIVERQFGNSGIPCSELSPYWEIDLEYMVDNDGNVSPCWHFLVDSTRALEQHREDPIPYLGSDFAVHAVTGAIIQTDTRYPARWGEDGKVHSDRPR